MTLVLVAAAAAITPLSPLRRAASPAAPAGQPQPGLPLSKEYIYAGGRLVATEGPAAAATPAPTPTGAPPTALAAVASFPTQTTFAVSLTWSAPSPESVAGYIVERAETSDEMGRLQYGPVGSPVTTLPTVSSPYVDQTAAEGKVYIYRVKAVFHAGGSSDYSGPDLATTVRYSGDDPLVGKGDPQGRPASTVRAAILTELRDVVNAVRTLAKLDAAVWRDDPPDNPRPQPQVIIRAWHFDELRKNLNPALAALHVAEVPPDQTLAAGQPIKATHIQDVRERIR